MSSPRARGALPRSAQSGATVAAAGLTAVTALGLAHFVIVNLPWVTAVLSALVEPASPIVVAGAPSLPPGFVKGLALVLLALAIGAVASDLILSTSSLAASRALRTGVSLALGVSLVGLPGVWALSVGQCTVPFVLGAEATIGVGLALMVVARRRTTSAAPTPLSTKDASHVRPRHARLLPTAMVALVAVVVLLTAFHALMSPVTEWDALIYHVAAARLWYLGRPAPALHFGPSVGIELSGNFPPLYPAITLTTSLVGGAFQTLWGRIASPLMYLSLLLIAFGYARTIFSRATGYWTIALLLGSPTLLIFAMEATNYMLLATLVLTTVVLADAAWQRRQGFVWMGVGATAGFAAMTNYIGLLAIGCAILLICVRPRHHLKVSTLAYLMAGFVAVAGPWFIRDWVLLGDPLYPLTFGIWHGRALNNPLYLATLHELKVSALGAWAGSKLPLVVAEALTGLSGGALLAVGGGAGLLYACGQWRRGSHRLRWLALTSLVAIVVLLLPGWYWTRYLAPLVAIMAILSAAALSELARVAHSWRLRGGVGPRACSLLTTTTLCFAAMMSVGVGVGLGVAGPAQFGVVTPALPDGVVSYLTNLRAAGSAHANLWYAFSGDYLSWQWLNSHTNAHEVIGTLDPRTLYLSHPLHVLYLDGTQALPLLTLTQPADLLAYFRERHVRWLVVPENARSPQTFDPVLKMLPLISLLGTRPFPLRAVFAVNDSPWLTEVFSVGGVSRSVTPAVFPGFTSPPPQAPGEYIVADGTAGAVIQIPQLDVHGRSWLMFQFCRGGASAVSVLTRVMQRPLTLVSREMPGGRCGHGWQVAHVPLPTATPPTITVRLFVTGSSVRIRSLRVVTGTVARRTAQLALVRCACAQMVWRPLGGRRQLQ